MTTQQIKLTTKDFRSEVHNNWCPGCGDFGIIASIQGALAQLQIPPHNVAVISGIGCAGKAPHYFGTYGFHTLHGRAVPSATGMKLANLGLTVLAVGGDGDGYGIGAGYFLNAGRRNLDFTYIVFDNGVYGLTKGQGSPTLARGLKTKSMPEPAIQDGINPLALAIGAGYTFVARGYALDVRHLTNLVAKAVAHKGTSFIDVLQTCPTYNDLYTKEWFQGSRDGQSRIYKIEESGYDGVVKDPSDADEIIAKKLQAVQKSYEWGDKIPLGVLYQVALPTYEQEAIERRPSLGETPLSGMKLEGRDTRALLDALR